MAKPEESAFRSFAEFTLRCFAALSMTSEGLRMTTYCMTNGYDNSFEKSAELKLLIHPANFLYWRLPLIFHNPLKINKLLYCFCILRSHNLYAHKYTLNVILPSTRETDCSWCTILLMKSGPFLYCFSITLFYLYYVSHFK